VIGIKFAAAQLAAAAFPRLVVMFDSRRIGPGLAIRGGILITRDPACAVVGPSSPKQALAYPFPLV